MADDQHVSEWAAAFGARLEALVEASGLTRKLIRHRASVAGNVVFDESDLRRYFRGIRPGADRIGPLADALGVTVDYLLLRTDNPLGAVIPGHGEVGVPQEPAGQVLKDAVDQVERQRSGAAASRRTRGSAQSPTQAQPQRARRRKTA